MFYRLRGIRRAFSLNVHTEYLYVHSLEFVPNVIGPEGLIIRKLTLSELPLLREIWPIDIAAATKRVERGDLCFGGFFDGRIACSHWVQYSGRHFVQPVGREYQISDGEGWIYHVRVADWARGRNVNSAVYKAIVEDARTKGMKSLFIYTGSSNFSNQKGLKKCAFNHKKVFVSIRIGNRFFHLLTKPA